MRQFFKSRVRTAIVASIVTAGLVGGVAVARATTSANTYTGCLSTSGKIDKVKIGTSPTAACGSGKTQISWGEGTQGDPGVPGVPGATGATLSLIHI